MSARNDYLRANRTETSSSQRKFDGLIFVLRRFNSRMPVCRQFNVFNSRLLSRISLRSSVWSQKSALSFGFFLRFSFFRRLWWQRRDFRRGHWRTSRCSRLVLFGQFRISRWLFFNSKEVQAGSLQNNFFNLGRLLISRSVKVWWLWTPLLRKDSRLYWRLPVERFPASVRKSSGHWSLLWTWHLQEE